MAVRLFSIAILVSYIHPNISASSEKRIEKELLTSGTSVLDVDDDFSAQIQPCRIHYLQPLRSDEHSDFQLVGTCYKVRSRTDLEGISKLYGGCYKKSLGWIAYYASDSDKALLSRVSSIYQIKNLDVSGFARTTDEVNGEFSKRTRLLDFCVFSGDKALCGHGEVMRLSKPNRTDLPYALKIIRTIKFVSDKNDSEKDGRH